MENVVLSIHLILAFLLIGAVLLQRSEGGGLGMGGGNSVMSGRGAATALSKLTWGFAVCFIATSLTLTWLAAERAKSGSVIDALATPEAATGEAPAEGTAPAPTGNLLPDLPSPTAPAGGDSAPATPSPTAPASN